MIESIRIAGIATYSCTPEFLTGLSKFNFLYGANGSGKTTITRVIADDGGFPTCSVTWKGTKLQTMVYNHDFVTKNFSQSSELKGIFTLGETNIALQKEIAVAKGELDAITKRVDRLHFFLHGDDGSGGKMGELADLDEKFKNRFWSVYKKHKVKFDYAFEGCRNRKEKVKDKILKERECNAAPVTSLASLEKRAETLFSQTPTLEHPLPSIDAAKTIAHESAATLQKRVVGRQDVAIAMMIKKLGNSDWVRGGLVFYDTNKSVCPFCQQSTTDALSRSFNDYFDDLFMADLKAIDDLLFNYRADSAQLQQQIASLIETPSKFFDVEKLNIEKELLDTRVTINLQRLALKKKEPSQIIELESIGTISLTIKTLIDDANVLISSHNTMVQNLAQERQNLTAQVWKFMLEVELKKDLAIYDTLRNSLNKVIADVTAQIASATLARQDKSKEIRKLEKSATSIQPTIDDINALLLSVGFQGFSLAKASNERCYKLIRKDGTDARETLSDGEWSFVAFLYFYHLLKGSNSETGMTMERVAVFDDPVSSLDNEILLIVGSLIKGLFDGVRVGKGNLKQIFVFTHNLSFYKEITFNPDYLYFTRDEATFWTVRKTGLESKIQKHRSNYL